MTTMTPMGVSDFLPEETARFNSVISRLNTVFSTAGYEEIQTPTVEFFDALSVGMGPEFGQMAVKFFDANGQVLVLRPDHTVATARMVATRMSDRLPLKLSYFNPIFRNPDSGCGEDLEIFQAGVEHFGTSGPQADFDLIKLCVQSVLALGITDFALDIGHRCFVDDYPESARELLLSGDYVGLGEIPKRGKQELVQAYPELCELYRLLEAEGLAHYVFFNKGLVKSLDYYTGVIFECSIPGLSQPLVSGGRYDNLVGKFGLNCPAIGFAITVSHLRQDIL